MSPLPALLSIVKSFRRRCPTLRTVFFYLSLVSNSLRTVVSRELNRIPNTNAERAHTEYWILYLTMRDIEFTPNRVTTTTTTTTIWWNETPNNATLNRSSCLFRTRHIDECGSQLDSSEQFCFKHFIPVECESMKSADGYFFLLSFNRIPSTQIRRRTVVAGVAELKLFSEIYFHAKHIKCNKKNRWISFDYSQ